MSTFVSGEPVLIGRESELSELINHLDLTTQGKGTTIFISGEAGSGKTRLATEFLSIAREKNFTVLSSGCFSDVAAPYFPFMQAFDSYFIEKKNKQHQSSGAQSTESEAEQTASEEANIRAWLMGPKQVDKPEKMQLLTPQGWKDLTVAAVTKALLAMSQKNIVIFFIDDLQWADSASLSLIHFLSRSARSARILILGTYRAEELTISTEGRPHLLLETLRLMRREDLFKEVKLTNLEQDNVLKIAERIVGGKLHFELANRLSEECFRNPLFVVESMRMLYENGSLVQENGFWRLSIDEVGIPDKIKDIVLRRASVLKPNQRRILDLASIIGEKLDLDLFTAATSQDSLELLETLSSIIQSTSLIYLHDNICGFDHAKSREIIYNEIAEPLKKAYHLKVAKVLETKGTLVPVTDIAFHYIKAGNKEQGIRYSLAAGKDSLERFSNAEAIKHFTFVLETYSNDSEYARNRLDALEGLGDAYVGCGLLGEGAKTYELLSKEAESGEIKLRAQRKAMHTLFWRGDLNLSLQKADEAEQYRGENPIEYARILVWKARVLTRFGEKEEAKKTLDNAIKVFESVGSYGDLIKSGVEIAILKASLGQIKEAISTLMVVANFFDIIGELRGNMYALTHLGAYLTLASQFDEALERLVIAIKIGEKIVDFQMTAWPLYFSGMACEIRGNQRFFSLLRTKMMNYYQKSLEISMSAFLLEDPEIKRNFELAAVYGLKAADYAEKADAHYIQFLSYGNLVRAYSNLGDIDNAETYLKKLDGLIPRVKASGDVNLLAGGIESKAVLLSEKKAWKDSNDSFEECIRLYQEKPKQTAIETTLNFFTRAKGEYGWCLLKQGRFADAMTQFMTLQKTREGAWAQTSFENGEIIAYAAMPPEVGAGEKFRVYLNFANVSKTPCKLLRVDGLVSPDFSLSSPSSFIVQNGSLDLGQKEVGPFKVFSIRVDIVAAKPDAFLLSPQVSYVDDLGENKIYKLAEISLSVRPVLHAKIGQEDVSVAVLPKRVSTGFNDLDVLLMGGIPENYAVILASPSIDEKESLIKKFLEAGARNGESTFLLTAESGNAMNLVEKYPSSFSLFVCRLQAEASNRDLSNIYRLKGVENLTEIDIALTKYLRSLDSTVQVSKRACIEVISDVLLQHQTVTTRKWLSGLISILKSKGFTVLGVINPQMHLQEDVQAILGVFDGEIKISEKETAKGTEKVLRVRRLYNQRYLENELTLVKDKLD